MSAVDLAWGTAYDRFIEEAWPLIRTHWEEVGSNRDILRLNPDHDRYRSLERAGVLHILLARTGGAIAGYMFLLVSRHPRDMAAMVATDDVIYVRPEYRRLGVGRLLIDEAIRFAGELRVHIVMFHAKARRRNSNYLARWGFRPHEIVYSKVIAKPQRLAEAAE